MDIYIFGAIGIGAGAIMGSLARGTPLRRAVLYAACTVLGFWALEFALQRGLLGMQAVVTLLLASATLGLLSELINRRRGAARLSKADGSSDIHQR
jgi:hypothetical protein